MSALTVSSVQRATLRLVTQRDHPLSTVPPRPSPLDWAREHAVLRTADGRVLRYADVARDYQDAILADTSSRIIVAKSRQIGISQVVAFIVAHEAIHGGTVVVVSRNGEQAQKFLKYVSTAIARCDHPPLVRDNLTALEFANGGSVEVQAATKGAGRGIAATLVVLDEMAWMEYGDTIYTAVTPTLAETGGRLIILSSANGRANLFYQLWEEAQRTESGWAYHFLPWWRHPEWATVPRWPELKKEADKLTDEAFAQEYDVDFLVSGAAVFDPEDIAALWRMPGFVGPEQGHRYLSAWDIARKQDAFVGFTLDLSTSPFRVVAFEYHKRLSYPDQAAKIEARATRYAGDTYVESNGVGDPLIQFVKVAVKEFVTNPLSKRNAIDALKLLLQRRELISPLIPEWQRELGIYQLSDQNIPQDTVMAGAIAALHAGRPVRKMEAFF